MTAERYIGGADATPSLIGGAKVPSPFVGEDAGTWPPATWYGGQWRTTICTNGTGPAPTISPLGQPSRMTGADPRGDLSPSLGCRPRGDTPSLIRQVCAIGTAAAIFFGGLVGVVATLAADRLRRTIGGGR